MSVFFNKDVAKWLATFERKVLRMLELKLLEI
jgi:hypothetical protein